MLVVPSRPDGGSRSQEVVRESPPVECFGIERDEIVPARFGRVEAHPESSPEEGLVRIADGRDHVHQRETIPWLERKRFGEQCPA